MNGTRRCSKHRHVPNRTSHKRGATMASLRVGIYGRVSTTNHGQDVNVQTRELEQFATARAWSLVDSYLDIGISGAKDKRPELDRLMADARRRRFDVVLVYR